MTLMQYNITDLKQVGEYKIPVFSSVPEQFNGAWFQITKVNLTTIEYVICAYFNKIHPEGTVIISESMHSDYPDLYATFNYIGRNERVYINPKYRKQGLLGIFGLIMRSAFYEYLGVIVDVPLDRNKKTEKATVLVKTIWQEKIEELPIEKRSSISVFDIDPPRDPIYPNIWHKHRVGGRNG